MAEETDIAAIAEDAVKDVLEGGTSRSHDGGSVRSAPIDKINDIANDQVNKKARRNGQRPLFRGIDLSGLGY
jgi:hypothetical protein